MKYQGTDIHLGLGTHFQRDFEAAHYGKLGDNAAFSIAGFIAEVTDSLKIRQPATEQTIIMRLAARHALFQD